MNFARRIARQGVDEFDQARTFEAGEICSAMRMDVRFAPIVLQNSR